MSSIDTTSLRAATLGVVAGAAGVVAAGAAGVVAAACSRIGNVEGHSDAQLPLAPPAQKGLPGLVVHGWSPEVGSARQVLRLVVAAQLHPAFGICSHDVVDHVHHLGAVRPPVNKIAHLHHNEAIRHGSGLRIDAQAPELFGEDSRVPAHVSDHGQSFRHVVLSTTRHRRHPAVQ